MIVEEEIPVDTRGGVPGIWGPVGDYDFWA